jgi:outer membrane protein insertion porin family
MTPLRWALLSSLFFSTSLLPAQCANDHRDKKNAGILISDFNITGTQTISTTDLARITGDMIGSCYDEDSEEMEERLRASFQDRGYFQVEVKSLRFKPRDPLGVPKPVTLEGDVSEGPQYRLGQVSFVKNHAFSDDELRKQFPIKAQDLVERSKIATGLESLRKLYGTRGYIEFTAVPNTQLSSNGIMNLTIELDEGPQYHMGKLEIVAEKEAAARLRAEWKLTEGAVYDQAYIDEYLTVARDLLPANFTRANVQVILNCPDALIHVRLIVDPAQDTSKSQPKNVPCEDHDNRRR